MINVGQFREFIIHKTLEPLGLYSVEAEELLVGTCAQESRMGTFVKQIGTGPALGIFQMEPATHQDILINFLAYQPELSSKVIAYISNDPNRMVTDMRHAVIMARLQYYRRPEPLPEVNDLLSQAEYWKQWYNTPLGAGTVQEYRKNYRRYVKGISDGSL